MILPSTADSLKLPHKGAYPSKRPWENHGWHDVQHLALLDNAGKPKPSVFQSSVVPDVDLGRFTIPADFDAGYVHVATVVMHKDPKGSKYETKFAFEKGNNEVFLRTDSRSPTGWRAEVRNATGAHELPVDRHPHNTRVPGTARFRWLDSDEGLWVRCDDGCCRVAGK